MMNKKGQSLEAMTGLSLFFITLIILYSLASNIVQEINTNVPDNSTADNVTTQGNQGLQQFAEFAPIMGLVIIAVILLGTIKLLKA